MPPKSPLVPLSDLKTVSQLLSEGLLPRVPKEKRAKKCRAVAGRIALVQGDITKLEVDAIVNAANPRLDGGGGVDGAIHSAAGPDLLKACKKFDGCATGDAKTTEGFKLPADWVVHTVGPVYRQAKKEEHTELLRSCYRRSLEEAVSKKAKTIAFPSISTGIYGFPIDGATKTAIDTVSEFLSSSSDDIDLVVFCTFSQRDHDVYADYLSYMVADEGDE